MTDFAHFFAEQDFFEVLGLFAGLAAVYFTVFASVTLLLFRRRLTSRTLRAGLFAGALGLGAFVVGLTLFEASALYFRSVPYGSGAHRTGADFETFVSRFELAFVALYVIAIVLTGLLSYAVGRRIADSPGVAAALCVGALAGFLVVSLPAVEFVNSCDIGRSLFIESDC